MVEFSNFFFLHINQKIISLITYYNLEKIAFVVFKKKNLVQSAEIDKFHIYIYIPVVVVHVFGGGH